jgi:hypothetical protein
MWLSVLMGLLAFCPNLQIETQQERRNNPGVSAPAQNYPDRREFVARMGRIRNGDTKETVEKLLGPPDDIWRAPNQEEVWCYGTDGHLSLPTLGQVFFREKRVIWEPEVFRTPPRVIGTSGGNGTPPSPKVLSEEELRAGMRYLYTNLAIPGDNDPLHLIRVANYLQPLGKDKALAIIGEYARLSSIIVDKHMGSRPVDETWLFLLLRTLFEVPQPPGYMPQMYIGWMSPSPPKNRQDIPRFPIVIVEGIPFSLLKSATLSGEAESVLNHVEYFRQHGTMRTTGLRPADDPFLAFQKLKASDEWRFLSQQVFTEDKGDRRRLDQYEGHTLLQVLALVRTAYDPPIARNLNAYPNPADFARYYQEFLKVGARWDDKRQMYVRKDGTHGEIGQLVHPFRSRNTPQKRGL